MYQQDYPQWVEDLMDMDDYSTLDFNFDFSKIHNPNDAIEALEERKQEFVEYIDDYISAMEAYKRKGRNL